MDEVAFLSVVDFTQGSGDKVGLEHDDRWRTADITPTSAAGKVSGSPTDVQDPTNVIATMLPCRYVDLVARVKDTHTQHVALVKNTPLPQHSESWN
jgi:hypothetical protein